MIASDLRNERVGSSLLVSRTVYFGSWSSMTVDQTYDHYKDDDHCIRSHLVYAMHSNKLARCDRRELMFWNFNLILCQDFLPHLYFCENKFFVCKIFFSLQCIFLKIIILKSASSRTQTIFQRSRHDYLNGLINFFYINKLRTIL